MPSRTEYLTAVVASVIFLFAAFAVGANYQHGKDTQNWADLVPCQEDEVVSVQLDPNPEHGLTWACENSEEFIERFERYRVYFTPTVRLDTTGFTDLRLR